MSDKVAIEISKESFEFMKSLANEIKNQDNRYTAQPYYYVVRCVDNVLTKDGFGDIIRYVDMKDDYLEFKNKEEARERFIEYGLEGDELEKAVEDLEECNYTERYSDENFFLTERGYNQHIKLNGHNYRHHKDFYSYVRHAARNPEIESLLKAVMEFGGEDD